jgi:predicted ATPase
VEWGAGGLLVASGGRVRRGIQSERGSRVRGPQDGGLVLYGRWNEEVLAPYQAFREALDDYGRACPDVLLSRDLRDLAGEIVRLCPELGQRIGASTPPLLGAAEADRFRLFDSLDTWIQRMADRHPVLFVLDDLH